MAKRLITTDQIAQVLSAVKDKISDINSVIGDLQESLEAIQNASTPGNGEYGDSVEADIARIKSELNLD